MKAVFNLLAVTFIFLAIEADAKNKQQSCYECDNCSTVTEKDLKDCAVDYNQAETRPPTTYSSTKPIPTKPTTTETTTAVITSTETNPASTNASANNSNPGSTATANTTTSVTSPSSTTGIPPPTATDPPTGSSTSKTSPRPKREIADNKARCFIVNYKENNQSKVKRGCSTKGTNEPDCKSLLKEGQNSINCTFCDGDKCNLGSHLAVTLLPLILALILNLF